MRAALVNAHGTVLLRESAPTPGPCRRAGRADRAHRQGRRRAGPRRGVPRRGRTPRRRRLRRRTAPVGAAPARAVAGPALPRRADGPARPPRPHRQRRRPGGGRRGHVRCRRRRAPTSPILTISTGIGAGVVNGGRLLRGRRSLAEVGHTVIDWLAWRDGRPSTLEELGSGSGVARLARRGRSRDPRRPRGRGERRERVTPRAIGIWQGRHRRLCGRVSQPRHVLLPEHRRHRGRPGTAGRVLRVRSVSWS